MIYFDTIQSVEVNSELSFSVQCILTRKSVLWGSSAYSLLSTDSHINEHRHRTQFILDILSKYINATKSRIGSQILSRFSLKHTFLITTNYLHSFNTRHVKLCQILSLLIHTCTYRPESSQFLISVEI